jgi:chemotaxis-related protein WspD
MSEPSPRSSLIDDCWNRIGVRGDGSCPELEQVVHCRNCPVFARAAVRLLDRELPADYAAQWATDLARATEAAQPGSHSAIIFRIGTEWFAFSTQTLDESSELRTIHSLPHRRNGTILGLVNVRGELVVCISLARMLGLEETTPLRSAAGAIGKRRLLILRHDGGRVAAAVDEVQGPHRYHPRDLRPVPASVHNGVANYTSGLLPWRGTNVGYLDESRIVQSVNRSAP